MFHDVHAQRRAFWTNSLLASELNIPPPQSWPAQSVSAGLAPEADGKSISFWLAPGVLQELGDPRGSRHSIRLDLDAGGNESLTFRDRQGRPRLLLSLGADGSPSIRCLATNGTVVWSAFEPTK